MRTSFGVSDSVSKTFGNHSLSFGGDLWHQYAKEHTQYPTQPIINFNGSYTGFGLADFLLGKAARFTQGAGEIADVSGIVLGLFAQDQYRIRPTVTLTAGVRCQQLKFRADYKRWPHRSTRDAGRAEDQLLESRTRFAASANRRSQPGLFPSRKKPSSILLNEAWIGYCRLVK